MSKRARTTQKMGITTHYTTKLPGRVAQKVTKHDPQQLKPARSCKWNIQPSLML